MADDPFDMWPAEIEVPPLTPLEILTRQADRLGERTKGMLRAEVVSTEGITYDREDPVGKEAVHRFEIIAPGLNNYRYQLLRCHHDIDFVYPVHVVLGDPLDEAVSNWEAADTEAEFNQLVRKQLNSKRTVSVLQSLLARIRSAGAVPAA